ncbi:MAG: ABC transporter substrate-binding protein [Thermoplasmata archaeon]|nr:ABC transporter substrate-binding protein [Thermoplasmata archaeon]
MLTVLTAFAVIPNAAVPAAAAADQPNVLYIGMQQDIPDFNTWNLASNSVWKSNVINWGFEGMVGLDFDGLPMPVLAESWTFDEATLTWTFNLRQGVTFHDGTSFTADDVVFVYQHAREGTTYTSNIVNAFDTDNDGVCTEAEMTTGVVKVDDYTVEMTMGSEFGLFLTATAGIPIVPKAIWENHLTEDGLLDVLWNHEDATISTGPWMYLEGEDNSYRIMGKYDGYWGKEATTPLGYKFWAPNIDQLYYKMYASIDTAILALQSGEVDHLPWAITAGRVPSLQADPNIKLFYESDNGYFYLAFNMKFDPMGDINFRQAISHVIDKDQIVNVYMGGFGSKGDAAEPPFWGEDAWYNATVEKYPFDADYSTPNGLLDAAGFTDQNGDGWRDLPDGTPMQKITLLTPPADYDPIRIRAGQMIAKNMRDGLHINAEAKALDFDTLVTRLQSMDYQMLIIGWSLSSDPVGNVFDILGPYASSNTFGFWSEANPNPFYKDLFGVVTRADAETQALAEEVLRLEDLAKSSFDVSDQIMYTRWAEGVLAEALPCNVLYYRVNVEAATTRWTGWLSYLGQIYGPGSNLFSLGNLVKTGAGGGGAVATASVNAGLSLPGKILVGETADAYVKVIDNTGAPVEAATVTVTVEGVAGPVSVAPTPSSGPTDADGLFSFALTGSVTGYSYVNVSAVKSSVTSTASGSVRVVSTLPTSLAMMVSASKMALRPGETSDVVVKVTDQGGAKVAGATVSIDPNLVSYGTTNWTTNSAVTNADGKVFMEYSAPADISQYMNSHLTLSLSYAATKTGYAWPAAAAANLIVLNEDAPDWTMAQVDAATTGTVSTTRAANATSIAVMVTDDDGNPLADHMLGVEYSNEELVFDPTMELLTDGSGQATLDVQFKDSADSAALRVVIKNMTALNAVPATVTLTYAGDGTVPTMYGGYMIWDLDGDVATQEPQFMGPVGAITATAYIWDQDGVAADGINASLVVSGTPYGSLAWCDLINWDSTWDGWGINIMTDEDDANLVTSGPFNTYYDYDSWDYWYNEAGYIYWDDYGYMTGVDIVGGELTIEIYGVEVAPVDLIGQVFVVPEGLGTFNDTTFAYNLLGSTTISGDYALGRSYDVAAAQVTVSKPVLTIKAVGFDSSFVDIVATDENNDPIEYASAMAYENSLTGNANYMVIPYASATRMWSSASVATDADGFARSTLVAVGKNYVISQASVKANLFAKASEFGAISMFAQNQVIMHVAQAYVTLDPVQDTKMIGEKVSVTATATNSAGGVIPMVPIELSAAGGATVAQAAMATDANGQVTFEVDTSGITGARAAFVAVQAKCGGIGYEVGLATMAIPVMNQGPTISVLSPAEDGEVVKKGVVMTAAVSDPNGVQTVRISVDGGAVTTVQGTAGDLVWDISQLLGDLEAGEHSVLVNATDSLGVSSVATVTFTAVSEEAGTSMAIWGLLIAGWVIAAVVVVMMLIRRPKSPEASMAEEPKAEEPKL